MLKEDGVHEVFALGESAPGFHDEVRGFTGRAFSYAQLRPMPRLAV